MFRSGLIYRRGNGKIFYFAPGHETYPIYHDAMIQMVLRNAVKWAAPEGSRWVDSCPNVPIDEAPNPIELKGPRLHQDGDEGLR